MKTLLYTLGVISIGFNMAAASHAWSSDNDWVLVFEDDFSGSSLNTHNWSRIDYVTGRLLIGANTNLRKKTSSNLA